MSGKHVLVAAPVIVGQLNHFLSAPCEFFELIMRKMSPALKKVKFFCPNFTNAKSRLELFGIMFAEVMCLAKSCVAMISIA